MISPPSLSERNCAAYSRTAASSGSSVGSGSTSPPAEVADSRATWATTGSRRVQDVRRPTPSRTRPGRGASSGSRVCVAWQWDGVRPALVPLLGRRAWQAASVPRFTRAELESFRDAEVPDLIGPDVRLLFVGINPGLWTAATQTHFAHPVNRFYPALLEAGIITEPISPSAGHDRRRPRPAARAGHRHHQPGPPGHRQGLRALRRGAARRWAGARGDGPPDHAEGGRDRRHHGVPHRLRAAARGCRTAARSRSRAPSCGSCRTRAGSTPTRRCTPWRSRTARPRARRA